MRVPLVRAINLWLHYLKIVFFTYCTESNFVLKKENHNILFSINNNFLFRFFFLQINFNVSTTALKPFLLLLSRRH